MVVRGNGWGVTAAASSRFSSFIRLDELEEPNSLLMLPPQWAHLLWTGHLQQRPKRESALYLFRADRTSASIVAGFKCKVRNYSTSAKCGNLPTKDFSLFKLCEPFLRFTDMFASTDGFPLCPFSTKARPYHHHVNGKPVPGHELFRVLRGWQRIQKEGVYVLLHIRHCPRHPIQRLLPLRGLAAH